MNKNIGILSIIIGILIFIRCIFEKSDKIIYIVAGINIVAIIFVIYTIVERALHNIIAKIEKCRVPLQIRKREIKSTQLKIWWWSGSIGTVMILLYFSCWCSGLGNDIISILALGISVLDDEIVRKITENYRI